MPEAENDTGAQKNMGFVISDVARLLRRNFDRKASELGLTRAQWLVIAHLRHRDGIRQVELADILEIQPITLARHIDRLEAENWVERRSDPVDRRAKQLFLTDKVSSILQSMQVIGTEIRAEATKGMSPKEVELLVELLFKMRANLTG